MAGAFVERDTDATNYKQQPQPNSVVKPSSGLRSALELSMAELGVVTKTDAETTVKKSRDQPDKYATGADRQGCQKHI